ncbi:MAG: hypothetical protein AAF773_06785, partial [Cyanobacteria bacterium P01_D01_bin.115]
YRGVSDRKMFSMVSFRNSQFQAILMGLVIADAVSHGQMPWGRSRAELPSVQPGVTPWPGHVASDRWCHQIVTQLQSDYAEHPQPGAPALTEPRPSELSEPLEVASLLATLPTRLWQLEQRHHPDALNQPSPSALRNAVLAVFDHSLVAALNHDVLALTALIRTVRNTAEAELDPLSQTLVIGWQQVLATPGNFELAVGQSLYTASPALGLPVLTGVLSAAWGGENSLPIGLRQLLATPPPSLRGWLWQRWQITDATNLCALAQGLWQQWSGSHVTEGSEPPAIAVQPVFT